MRQKTRCVLFVEKQPAFLTLRLNEEQLQLLRNEMQGQLLEQFLCFGHIAKYFRERHHTAFAKPSTRFRYQNTSSFLKVFLNCKVKLLSLYLPMWIIFNLSPCICLSYLYIFLTSRHTRSNHNWICYNLFDCLNPCKNLTFVRDQLHCHGNVEL